jgi:hypothetical protein
MSIGWAGKRAAGMAMSSKMLLLACQRLNEVAQMSWAEVDLAAKT